MTVEGETATGSKSRRRSKSRLGTTAWVVTASALAAGSVYLGVRMDDASPQWWLAPTLFGHSLDELTRWLSIASIIGTILGLIAAAVRSNWTAVIGFVVIAGSVFAISQYEDVQQPETFPGPVCGTAYASAMSSAKASGDIQRQVNLRSLAPVTVMDRPNILDRNYRNIGPAPRALCSVWLPQDLEAEFDWSSLYTVTRPGSAARVRQLASRPVRVIYNGVARDGWISYEDAVALAQRQNAASVSPNANYNTDWYRNDFEMRERVDEETRRLTTATYLTPIGIALAVALVLLIITLRFDTGPARRSRLFERDRINWFQDSGGHWHRKASDVEAVGHYLISPDRHTRIVAELSGRVSRRVGWFLVIVLDLLLAYAAFRFWSSANNWQLSLVAVWIAIIPFVFMTLWELIYRSGRQSLKGAMVIDPEPERPGLDNVSQQKVHGDARMASESEALNLLNS